METKPLIVPPQPASKPLHCRKCNRHLGQRVPMGLHTGVLILHPRQSFTCARCKTRYESVQIAFAGLDADAVPELKPETNGHAEAPALEVSPPVPKGGQNAKRK